MIISIALLGYAASGTFLSVFKEKLNEDIDRSLTVSSALFSITMLLSFIGSNQIPFDPSTFSWDILQTLYIGGYYLLISVPFFFSGLTLGLTLGESKTKINRVYFSSFIGSALGTLLILPLFSPLGGPGVIVLISIVGGVSAIAFALNTKKLLKATISWTILLIILLNTAGAYIPFNMSPYKSLNIALRYPGAELLETHWNAFSKIDVVKSGYVRYAPGLSLRYDAYLPEQIGIFIDGDEVNSITHYDGNPSSLNFTDFLPSALPYQLLEEPRVLIVDAGGGLGVLTAIFHESSTITIVEENPIIVDLVKNEYASFSGSIYQNPVTHVYVSDGRSFIQGQHEDYDLIELSMTGGTSASSSGLYALFEDYLYTVESFSSFMWNLSGNGFFSVSRWLLPPPREDIKIVSLAVAALESMGISDPWQHIAVIRSWDTMNLIVGKSPLSQDEISSIRIFSKERGFDIVYVPGIDTSEVNIYNKFPEPIYYNIVKQLAVKEKREEFYRDYLYDISPTTDEKPFFFNFFKWDRLTETYNALDKKWQALIEGGLMVPIVFLQALILSVLIVILPMIKLGGVKKKVGLIYYLLIGLGYMFIEITTIQRFILILGNSVYSISFVLFSLLLSSGIGSYFSDKVKPGSMNHVRIIQLLGILSIFYGVVSQLVWLILGLEFSTRILLSFIFIFPLGFLMGIPFPLGIRMHSASEDKFIG
jgi:hypothetical protein